MDVIPPAKLRIMGGVGVLAACNCAGFARRVRAAGSRGGFVCRVRVAGSRGGFASWGSCGRPWARVRSGECNSPYGRLFHVEQRL